MKRRTFGALAVSVALMASSALAGSHSATLTVGAVAPKTHLLHIGVCQGARLHPAAERP